MPTSVRPEGRPTTARRSKCRAGSGTAVRGARDEASGTTGRAPTNVGHMSASERRGAARTSVVWESLREVFGASSDVLDTGGGTGGFAVRVAELGHPVRVIDPSPDALAALGRGAQELAVADRVVGQQGDLSTLLDVAGPDSADVVLCHGVLAKIGSAACRERVCRFG